MFLFLFTISVPLFKKHIMLKVSLNTFIGQSYNLFGKQTNTKTQFKGLSKTEKYSCTEHFITQKPNHSTFKCDGYTAGCYL